MKNIFIGSFLLLMITACTHKSPVPAILKANNQLDLTRIDNNKEIFPIIDYPQEINRWIPPDKNNHRLPFISQVEQKNHLDSLISHYFGDKKKDKSPWNEHYIQSILGKSSSVKKSLYDDIDQFTLPNAVYYGENFRRLTPVWQVQMRHLASVAIDNTYSPASRGIALKETAVRLLPTHVPAFEDPRQAGQGYPFDMLQNSSIHPGEPVYIAGVTEDQSWSFIISPAVMGWVNSSEIAKVDTAFILQWRSMAKATIAGVTNNNASFSDQNGVFIFTAHTGTLLPLDITNGIERVALPVKNKRGYADIHYAPFLSKAMHRIPMAPTPENVAHIIKSMQGKNYGWGNLYGFNDCSAEIRNIMLPLGIFLPRNSRDQSMSGKRVDLSHFSEDERINYLMKYGKPFTTLIYIKGHVMLYIGNSEWKGKTVPITYQNLWGLRPANSLSRSIIGQSVFFPLLSAYPEDPKLGSLAGKPVFVLTFF